MLIVNLKSIDITPLLWYTEYNLKKCSLCEENRADGAAPQGEAMMVQSNRFLLAMVYFCVYLHIYI